MTTGRVFGNALGSSLGQLSRAPEPVVSEPLSDDLKRAIANTKWDFGAGAGLTTGEFSGVTQGMVFGKDAASLGATAMPGPDSATSWLTPAQEVAFNAGGGILSPEAA
jgi:hypothetical protein